MRRVLMVSPHFPPDSTAGTHRVRLLAPHLAANGWEPTVLSVDARDYEGRLDTALADSVPRAVRVIRTRAWSVSTARWLGIGDLGLRAFGGLYRGALRLLERERFDALFITIYPTYPALLGPLLKRRFGMPFVLDYQDPWVGEWGRSVGPAINGRPDLRSRATRFASTRLEPLALGAADAVTGVSSGTYESALARTPAARPLAVDELPIGWDQCDFDLLDARPIDRGRPRFESGQVNVSYVGTFWPAAIDTLRAVLAAAAKVRATESNSGRLRLHFFGTSSQRTADVPGRVLPIARELGVDDMVTESAARLDYFDALQVMRDSSAVLLIGSGERHYTPSKVFPALLSKRPVVAVLHGASTGAELLRRVGGPPAVRLVTFDEVRTPAMQVDLIANQLSQLVADPRHCPDAVNFAALEPSSAPVLAARLASMFDRVRSGMRSSASCR